MLGYQALAGGNNSTIVGASATDGGFGACVIIGQGSSCTGGGASVVVGQAATSGGSGVAVGAGASCGGPGNGVAVGNGASTSIAGSIAIGESASDGGFVAMTFGTGTTATGNNQFLAGNSGGGGTRAITDVYIGNGVSAATPVNTTYHATNGLGIGITGGSLILAGGVAGDAPTSGGAIKIQTAQGGNGTALVNRTIVNPTPKALTTATPVGLISINVPTGTMTGGQIRYTVRATDGTDYQAVSGIIYWTAVNQTGTAQADASANIFSSTLTTGTLTTAADTNVVTNTVTVRVTATSSLTTTIFDIQYQAENNSTQDITIL